MTKIKICGITNLCDAQCIVKAGADAAGFIFAVSHRRISPEKARAIITDLPPFIAKVGVFMNESIPNVKEIMDYCFLDLVQFHGEEDQSYLNEFGPRAVKVFNINERNVLEKIQKFSLNFLMLDLPKDEGKKRDWDWRIAREAKKWGNIILAGGLTPENIERVLEVASPYAVDVCRGVEGEYGRKNHHWVKRFILKVKKWDYMKT
jgi:phosphoribosylanthranilate isomerase